MQSSGPREPFIANVQASMFGDKQKFSRRNAAEMHISSADLPRRQPRAMTSHTDSRGLILDNQKSEETSKMMQQMHPEEAEILLDTHARNAVFKINMPHSQARMPNYLPNEQIRPKPFVPQRRHVHSYIYPSKFDLLRHEMKTKLRDKLNY